MCKTFLEVDRTQLLASREDAVAARPVFGVEGGSSLQLPDVCCVCMAPGSAEGRDEGRRCLARGSVLRRVAEASNEALVGRNDVKSTAGDRWLMLFIGLLMTAEGYEIVPASPKGILVWIAFKLLGWGWLALGLMAIALACFGAFAGSFKPARKPPAR